jgi:hypothetical protein
MERTKETQPVNSTMNHAQARLGAAIVILGLVFLLDLYLQTGWLNLLVLPLAGLLFLITSLLWQRMGWMIAGCIFLGVGVGIAAGFAPLIGRTVQVRIGSALLIFGLSWLLIMLLSLLVFHRPAWWSLVPGSVIVPAGLVLLFTPMRAV